MSENNYWTTAPFISHDGADNNGVRAEVKIGMGFTPIKDVEKGEKATQVEFKNPDSKWSSKGRIPNDSPLLKIIEEAYANSVPLYWRIESIRKSNVDRTKPFDEISPPKNADMARENIYKNLVGVKTEDAAEWTYGPNALTNPAEDPSRGGTFSAFGMDIAELRGANSQSQSSSSAQQYENTNGFFEPPAFKSYLPSGELSPGSHAVAAPLAIYDFLTEQNKNAPQSLDNKALLKMSERILQLNNRLQLSIYENYQQKPEKVDPSLASHFRAREILFSVVKDDFKTFVEADSDEWYKNVYMKSLNKWKWSIKVMNKLLSSKE